MQNRAPSSIKSRFHSSIFPNLNPREMSVLEERLKPKPSANGHSMDIEHYTIEGQDKESYLQILHQKVEDLENLMQGTKEQIEKLESDLYSSQSLLS